MWLLTIIPILIIYYNYKKSHKPFVTGNNVTTTRPFQETVDIYFTNYNWNISYHLGVAKFIQDFLDTEYIQFKGVSFGSLVSTALHLNIPIEQLYQYIENYIYHTNFYVFLWNYKKNYHMFIEECYTSSSMLSSLPIYVVLKGTQHLLEIQPIDSKNLLKISYDLPFPSIIPKKIVPYGYVRDCYWSSPPSMNELNVSITNNDSFPTPVALQIKSWFHPKSREDLESLYKIGYAKAFIFFHTNKEWIPYFKKSPTIENIYKCSSMSHDLDVWIDELNI
jgi:hypothetical protein